MKIIKKGMRVWITVAAAFSFLGGWILFSHSNKPAPLQFNLPVISAPAGDQPFQSLNGDSGTGGFPFSGQSQFQSFNSRLRTGGS